MKVISAVIVIVACAMAIGCGPDKKKKRASEPASEQPIVNLDEETQGKKPWTVLDHKGYKFRFINSGENEAGEEHAELVITKDGAVGFYLQCLQFLKVQDREVISLKGVKPTKLEIRDKEGFDNQLELIATFPDGTTSIDKVFLAPDSFIPKSS